MLEDSMEAWIGPAPEGVISNLIHVLLDAVYLPKYPCLLQWNPQVCPPFLRPSECPRRLQNAWVMTHLPRGKMEDISVPQLSARSQAKRLEVELLRWEAQMMLACKPGGPGRAWGGRERWRIHRLRRKGLSCTGPTDDSATSHTERGSVEPSPARKQKQRVEMFTESTSRGK